jgi:hypothetical protein
MANEDLAELDTLLSTAAQGPYFITFAEDQQSATFSVSEPDNSQRVLFTVALDCTVPQNVATLWLLAHSQDLAWVIAELKQRRDQVAAFEHLNNRWNPVIESGIRLIKKYPTLNLPGNLPGRTEIAELIQMVRTGNAAV